MMRTSLLILVLTFAVALGDVCTETESNSCHELATCDSGTCVCMPGTIGTGSGATGCSHTGYQLLVTVTDPPLDANGALVNWDLFKVGVGGQLGLSGTGITSMTYDISEVDGVTYCSFHAIFASENAADTALNQFTSAFLYYNGAPLTVTNKRVYTWAVPLPGQPIQIKPSGMDVTNVFFNPACGATGCWTIDVIYTLGENAFSTFFIPHAVGSDTLSVNPTYLQPVLDTFLPSKHPCDNDRYDVTDPTTIKYVSACCFADFISDYRPTETFVTWGGAADMCDVNNVPAVIERPDRPNAGDTFDKGLPATHAFQVGAFKGMDNSPGASVTGVVDPHIRQYLARIELDEVDLRTKAGQLKGTVGVEHTVDTFLGLANFKPTGLMNGVIDIEATQVAIHLEKTSFFTVSTYGEMQETFTEYVNIRIVRVCPENVDFTETTSEFTQTSWRNENDGCWEYVQVTIVIPPELQPNTDPTDSSPGSPAGGDDSPADSPDGGSPSDGPDGGDPVDGGDDETECTGPECCIGDGCDCLDGSCACVGTSGECCIGDACDDCVGNDCIDGECIGDACCFGSGCSAPDDDGDYTCTDDSSCCIGSECNECIGADCKSPTCLGSGCNCDSTGCYCLGTDDCCVGEHCGSCTGTGCQDNECNSLDCCVGDCKSDGTCEDNGVCCIGPGCNECSGPGCTSDSCYGDDCLCAGGTCSCESNDGEDCCLGDCDDGECVGVTCTSNTCIGSDCQCDPTGCSCPAGSSECCIGTSCTCVGEGCTGDGCSGDDCGQPDCTDCCYGSGCGEDENGDPTCEAEGACCIGSSCNECHGLDCEAPSCIGSDCDCSGDACTCTGVNCCIGSSCDQCYGDDCTPHNTCEGDKCCLGAGCSTDNSGDPTCVGASDCCIGADCNECYGDCTAPTCVGAECACTGFSCECPDESEACCIGTGCTDCYGADCPANPGEECTGENCCHGAGCNSDGTCTDDSHELDCCVGTGCVECVGQSCSETGPCTGADGLIPFDSVLAGKGEFMSAPTEPMEHMCEEYCAADQTDVENLLAQDCAPKSEMCVNPVTVDDQFISFNIPLGTDWLPDPSDKLDSNVFVEFNLNVKDTSAGAGEQSVKSTKVQASIPVVEGGVNQFCDIIVAKTDLKDVANIDIVIGSAMTYDEISRLRILQDVASTGAEPLPPATIDTDSIESGLMTLVVKGNATYFTQANGYRLELEDVITVHIMEGATCSNNDDPAASPPVYGCADDYVSNLLSDPPEDNVDSSNNNIDGDGYYLNGAFRFSIARDQNRASLEPTTELLSRCPFNPTRPSSSDAFPSTCVTRRDVRYRGYPARVGGVSTAIELPDKDVALNARDDMERFMTSIFGESDYAKDLGAAYSLHIGTKYKLNDRFIRAWFINPGYEWTPTQTGGKSIFSLSQKIFMFCLINLNEGFQSAPSIFGERVPVEPTLPDYTRRSQPVSRRLFTTAVDEGGSQMSSQQMNFDVSPRSLLASAYDLPIDRVATFEVEVALTDQEACMDVAALKGILTSDLVGAVGEVATEHETVQVVSFSVQRRGFDCNNLRRRLLQTSSAGAYALVETAVVFSAGTDAHIDTVALGEMERFARVKEIAGFDKVETGATAGEDFEPAGTKPNKDKVIQEDSSTGGGGSNTAVIAGVAGGIAGLLVIALGGFMFYKSRNTGSEQMAIPVESVTIENLKAQLQNDV